MKKWLAIIFSVLAILLVGIVLVIYALSNSSQAKDKTGKEENKEVITIPDFVS